ncbi:MBL fold metallo-hydrolase RNA specificity domain-containing protein [Arsenicibacter rosenii]|uniref:MBL fold metallo-hydrolase n=1 Tax=Arsenicibacter rosenii TaxID=1750698 RepID=A0A1S2VDP6_9BACT|nr:MBL fold metallo-hydrolase [Arsenicibacter rosenii]OIN56881.1 MBL fold metallo-hydrolase [Arsenicibacter rosenii]
MTIQFFGAARTVTGSKHLITTEKGTRILLDCGLFQGINTDELNQEFGFEPASIDYLILSHAHIDHTGLVPRLIRQGFAGPIYCTPATADLCEIMLMDSAHIQQKDLERINERRHRQGRAELDMLYDADDVQETLSRFKTVGYNEIFWLTDEIEVQFTDTAHLLGSAAINLTIHEKEGPKKVFFSGDIGRPNDKILPMPMPFPQADYIICESTYGNQLHEPEPDMRSHLLRIVEETCVRRQGKVIIPAFAVDRTQELIYALDQLESEGRLPVIPVFVDSPLAVKATNVMRQNEDCFNPEILAYIKKDGDAFNFKNLHYVSDVQESKDINNWRGPCIIISSSGMAEAGRIKHHIKNNIDDNRNTILIVGYCSPNSLGGALKRGDRQVRIFGETYEVKARIAVMDSFSAHADYAEMLDYLGCQDPKLVKKVFLVHGDYDEQLVWKEKLEAAGFKNVTIPDMREKVTL